MLVVLLAGLLKAPAVAAAPTAPAAAMSATASLIFMLRDSFI
jgi:hypothetical protein